MRTVVGARRDALDRFFGLRGARRAVRSACSVVLVLIVTGGKAVSDEATRCWAIEPGSAELGPDVRALVHVGLKKFESGSNMVGGGGDGGC